MKVSGDDKVTEEEFVNFCDGQSDPMLKFIDKEEKSSKAKLMWRRSSKSLLKQPSEFFGKQTSISMVHYENTYRMHPTKKFFPEKAAAIIKSVLEDALKRKSYDFATFSKLTLELSDRIKERVKESMDLPRYKLVSFVTVGQMLDQGVRVASRCVWDAKCDHYASSSYSNGSMFAVGVVYAAYFE